MITGLILADLFQPDATHRIPHMIFIMLTKYWNHILSFLR